MLPESSNPQPPPFADLQKLIWPLKIGLAATVFASVALMLVPNYYASEAVILPVETRMPSGIGELASLAANFGIGATSQEGADAIFPEVLGSRWLRERLLTSSFTFHARRWRFGTDEVRTQTLMSILDAPNVDIGLRRIDDIMTYSRNVKTRVLRIRAETRSPELSSQIIQSTLILLETFNKVKVQTRGGAKAAFAAERLKDAEREYAETEARVSSFINRNLTYQTSSNADIRLTGLRLEGELRMRQQLLTTLTLNREQALMEEKNDIPILNILDQGMIPLEKSGPHRSTWALSAFLISTVLAWLYDNRKWVKDWLILAKTPAAVQ